jgi:hypothetical protein
MLWLWLRWILLGPVMERSGDVLTLDQVRATKDSTAAGTVLALVAFLIFYTTGPRPMAPEVALPISGGLTLLPSGIDAVLFFLAGLCAGLFPRPYRHWTQGTPSLAWICALEMVVLISSGIAVFSLLAYFEWREAHGLLRAGFIGLVTGYRFAPLITRWLRF